MGRFFGKSRKVSSVVLAIVQINFCAECIHFWWRLCDRTVDAKKFVEQLKWIDSDEMLDLVALGQSAPGAIAVNTSILVGYRVAGFLGALVTVFGTVAPPLIIITIVSYFYMNFRENPIVDALMIGMQAGVAAVIVNVVIGMVSGVVKQRDIVNILLLLVAFIASYFFDVHVVLIIFLAGLIGFVNLSYQEKKGAIK